MKPILRIFSFLALICFAHTASAQVTFTVTATAKNTIQNYTSGDAYTFTFTLGNFTNLSATGSVSYSNSVLTVYREDNTTADQLWASVGGTGLQGTYVRPTGNPGDPASYLQAGIDGNNSLYIKAGTTKISTQTIGVTTLAGTALSTVQVYLSDAALPAWTMTNDGTPTSVTPEDYFSSYAGSYTGFTATVPDNFVELYDSSGGYAGGFEITSIAISAVPEPSTYAAMFGVAALAFAAWRRRRIKA